MRIKEIRKEEQQASEPSFKERAMEHLLASCNREECLKIIAKAYDRITYYDNITQALTGLWARSN